MRIPQRFLEIKIALSEGGIGWVPFALERVDRTWERHRYWAKLDDTPPSELFHRNFWVCFIDETAGVEARHRIGVDKIMWECDSAPVASLEDTANRVHRVHARIAEAALERDLETAHRRLKQHLDSVVTYLDL